MALELDCNLEENEFELQLPYYVHFPTNNLGKGIHYFNSLTFIG